MNIITYKKFGILAESITFEDLFGKSKYRSRNVVKPKLLIKQTAAHAQP